LLWLRIIRLWRIGVSQTDGAVIDTLGKTAWYASPFVGVAVFALTVWRARSVELFRRGIAAACLALACAGGLVILSFAVVLRDGLGPDALPSTGVTALSRTAETVPWLLTVLPFVGIGVWLLFAGQRREKRERTAG
jgi:hypothetical protein